MESWLTLHEYPHPQVKAGNRLPTKVEIINAIEMTGSFRAQDVDRKEFFAISREPAPGGEYEVRIGCSDWERLNISGNASITMHGNFEVELTLLEILSHRCGQLLLYPDTGDPCVVVEPGMDVGTVFALWKEAIKRIDAWQYFFGRMNY